LSYRKYKEFHKIIDGIELKQCKECLNWFNMTSDNFRVEKLNKDGFNHMCKTCQKEYNKNYHQFYKENGSKTGKTRGYIQRKFFNDYEIRDDITVIFIISKGEKFEILIDTEDLPKLIDLNLSWHVMYDTHTHEYYVASRNKILKEYPESLLLHRFILGIIDTNIKVDHKSHDQLDNRKNNLRTTTNDKNTRHRRGKNSNNNSGYRNVCWIYNKWCVQLIVDGKNKILGKFDDVHKAGAFAELMRQKYYKNYKGAS
jgi:hypothetical protein